MKLDLTMIVAIDTPKELSQSRSSIPPEAFNQRYQKWTTIAEHLKQTKDRIFWIDATISIGNMYEEVIHEL